MRLRALAAAPVHLSEQPRARDRGGARISA
jgi:hypothetical protein